MTDKNENNTEIVRTDEIAGVIRERIDAGGSAVFTVTGCSMNPLLYGGRDSVLIKPVSRPLKKHDIILFERSDGSLVLHRIVGTDGSAYFCRGDNRFSKPEKVTSEMIIGVTVAYTRNGKEKSTDGMEQKLYILRRNMSYPFRLFMMKVFRKLSRSAKK